ncbi:MAG: M48 family metallopeptidase [Acidobacteriota bacterium]
MWEAIQSNRRRSRFLILLMAVLLVGLGGLIGTALGGEQAALVGVLASLGIWLVLLAIALNGGERVVLASAGARQIAKQDAPRLFNVVEEMTIAAGLGSMPKVFVIDDPRPNAFAVGRSAETACVAVTAGLVRRLSRDELQGVVAHEVGHIKNLDTRFMTTALVMVGSIALLSDLFLRLLWFGGGRRRSSKGNPQVQIILMGVTLLAAVLAPVTAQLLYLACSRRREYLADASSARFTRYPDGLAAALEKIATGSGVSGQRRVPRAMAPLYIINPLRASSAAGLFSTHPPTARRVQILRKMAGTAGYADYDRAFRQVVGRPCLGRRTLEGEGRVAARAASAGDEPAGDALARSREVAELLDRAGSFLVLACACGVRIKVPPEHATESIRCPRCGRRHQIPRAAVREVSALAAGALAGVASKARGAAVPETAATPMAPLHYRRHGGGWETFRCACGKVQQISPSLAVHSVLCRGCHRRIEIDSPAP